LVPTRLVGESDEMLRRHRKEMPSRRRLDDRCDRLPVPYNVADGAILAVRRPLHGFPVRRRKHILLFDYGAAGPSQLIDPIKFHDPRSPARRLSLKSTQAAIVVSGNIGMSFVSVVWLAADQVDEVARGLALRLVLERDVQVGGRSQRVKLCPESEAIAALLRQAEVDLHMFDAGRQRFRRDQSQVRSAKVAADLVVEVHEASSDA